MVTLYAQGEDGTCPKCKILRAKLVSKGIEFAENNSEDEMIALGMTEIPNLMVGEELLGFKAAVDWVNAQ